MNDSLPSFHLQASCGNARAGDLESTRGLVHTPLFMPVGTRASVKTLDTRDLLELGAQILLANTYHLFLRPGAELIARAGGLHSFMSWSGPLLTDSGGFQVYSLGELREVREEGVEFRSHLDGSRHTFTPESVVEVQRLLGSDIMMALDECPPAHAERSYVERSMELSCRWAFRCRSVWLQSEPLHGSAQALFPVIQGGVHEDLRRRCIDELSREDWPGLAIGGLSVGEPLPAMRAMTELCCGLMPVERPRYLMGVGSPRDILESIDLGVDLFDCVLPTRNARKATLFTRRGRYSAKAAKYKEHFDRPVDPECRCYTCRTYDRAYLRHLYHVEEFSAMRLGTIHNLCYFMDLVRGARRAILDGRWKDYLKTCLDAYAEAEESP